MKRRERLNCARIPVCASGLTAVFPLGNPARLTGLFRLSDKMAESIGAIRYPQFLYR